MTMGVFQYLEDLERNGDLFSIYQRFLYNGV